MARADATGPAVARRVSLTPQRAGPYDWRRPMPSIRDDHRCRRSRPATPRLAPWRAFVRAQAHVSRRLDEDLRAEHGLSLQEYVALLILAEAPERRLRMGRLADSLTLSKSGATRLIDRLVDDGLVARVTCSSDLRGAEAALTEAGLQRLRTAAPTHLRGIAEYFLSAIDGRRPRGRRADDAGRRRPRLRHAGTRLTDRPGARPALVGTSGFAYPDWTPRFYPPGTRPADRSSRTYAARLPAVELNATFRRRPTPSAIPGWVRRDAGRVPVRGQGPARLRRPRALWARPRKASPG